MRYRSCERQRGRDTEVARGNMAGEKKPELLWQRGRRDTEVARGNVQGSVGWASECLHCEVMALEKGQIGPVW